MFKLLYDRLAFALIGFVFGALIATVLWFLYDLGFSRQHNHPEIQVGIGTWIKYVGGLFALIGFFFKAKVGDAAGETTNQVYEYESGNYHLPTWLVVVVLAGVAVAVWYFTRPAAGAAA